jgi:hypothetical protein
MPGANVHFLMYKKRKYITVISFEWYRRRNSVVNAVNLVAHVLLYHR